MRMGFLIAYMQFNWVINMTMKWFGTKVERKFHLFIHFNREDCSQISAGCDPHSAMRMSFLSWRVIVQNPHWHVCKYATIRLRMHAGVCIRPSHASIPSTLPSAQFREYSIARMRQGNGRKLPTDGLTLLCGSLNYIRIQLWMNRNENDREIRRTQINVN